MSTPNALADIRESDPTGDLRSRLFISMRFFTAARHPMTNLSHRGAELIDKYRIISI
jgi:hypothetical protein